MSHRPLVVLLNIMNNSVAKRDDSSVLQAIHNVWACIVHTHIATCGFCILASRHSPLQGAGTKRSIDWRKGRAGAAECRPPTHLTVASQQSSTLPFGRFLCLALSCFIVNLLVTGQLQRLVSQRLYMRCHTSVIFGSQACQAEIEQSHVLR